MPINYQRLLYNQYQQCHQGSRKISWTTQNSSIDQTLATISLKLNTNKFLDLFTVCVIKLKTLSTYIHSLFFQMLFLQHPRLKRVTRSSKPRLINERAIGINNNKERILLTCLEIFNKEAHPHLHGPSRKMTFHPKI